MLRKAPEGGAVWERCGGRTFRRLLGQRKVSVALERRLLEFLSQPCHLLAAGPKASFFISW